VNRLTEDPARPAGPAGVHPAGRTHPAPARRTSLTGRAAVFGLVLAALVVTLAIPVRGWFAQRAEISGLAAGVAAAEERVATLEAERDRWADPAFIEAQARQRLTFVMPGEVGYVVVDDTAPEPAEQAGTLDGPTAQGPWYVRLWGSVEAADEPPPAAPPSRR
jgi:cell division protein FtsB